MSSDPIRAAIQQLLDDYGDGWTLADYVVAMGLECVTADGTIETTPWWHAPPQQAEWVTDGLLVALTEMRAIEED
ncbi:hypothetical protein [Mycobacterium canetti]|uniref:DUF7213 family protein n=1 Tax=Mycobacterium canetti TaxID=78331 RepID=UPI0003469CF3|nr:hypothetical protein [Mycobacterium canetti]